MTISVFASSPKLQGSYYLSLSGSLPAKTQTITVQINMLFPCGPAKLTPTKISDDIYNIGS